MTQPPDKNTNSLSSEADIKKAVEARKAETAERLAKSLADKEPKKITSKDIHDCLYSNELGDGMLYAALHENKFVYNKSAQEWIKFNGHHWVRDIGDESLAAAENVAERYLQEARDMVTRIDAASKDGDKEKMEALQKTQGAIYKRVHRLRSDRGRNSCLKFAHTNKKMAIYIEGNELDTNHYYLACKNGVIDLRTGQLSPGRPEDYMFKASPVEWVGIDTPAPTWESTLNGIFQGDQDLIDYIGRLCGYGITGLTIEHVLPIFWGQGRNGKGTIVETISHVMGALVGPIVTEMLLDQGRVKNSSGPSPDIMGLRGLRIAFASEADEGRRFSPSRIKWLSGGDTLKGRHPHDKYETEFLPTHMLILLTNHKPHAPADDYAFWERVHLIPFNISFVDRKPREDYELPADKYLKEKMILEAPGILAWLVRGCLEWQRIGLAPPASVLEATAEYKRDEDLIQDFIDECCFLDPGHEVGASSLYSEFKTWFEENISKRSISQKKFGRMIGKKFKKIKSGTYKYIGLGLNSDEFGHRGP